MESQDVYVVGAGGHAREIHGVLQAMKRHGSNLNFRGFISEDAPDTRIMARISAPWLGSLDERLSDMVGARFVVGIGDSTVRQRVATLCEREGLQAVTLVHPTASLGDDVILEPGVVIFDHVSITTNIRIGRHVHINRNSTVGHDVRIGAFATLNPMVAISGNVSIGEGAQIGTHASVLQGLDVAAGATVGAGACVIRDVHSGTTVVGVPAKPLV